jgi:hypothetical protein
MSDFEKAYTDLCAEISNAELIHMVDKGERLQELYSRKRDLEYFFKLGVESVTKAKGCVLVPVLSVNYLYRSVPELGFVNQDEKDTVIYHLNFIAAPLHEEAENYVKNFFEKCNQAIEEYSND